MTRFGKLWKELKEWAIATLAAAIIIIVLLGIGTITYKIYLDYQITKQKIETTNIKTDILMDGLKELSNQNQILLDKDIELVKFVSKKYEQLNISIIENRKFIMDALSKTTKGFVNVNETFDFLEIDIKNLLKKDSKLENKIEKINRKPSYKYLKSITTYIIGTGTVTNKKGKVQKLKWNGAGSIIRVTPFTTYILTNAHVAGKGVKNVTLFVKDGLKKIEAELVAYHKSEGIDLAVIKIEGVLEGKRPIKGVSLAKIQDRVYLVGHHLSRKYVYGEGVFAGYDRMYDIIQIPVSYGNSGSAVINKDGELVGVIFAVKGHGLPGFFQLNNTHGLAVSGLSVKLFLQELNLL